VVLHLSKRHASIHNGSCNSAPVLTSTILTPTYDCRKQQIRSRQVTNTLNSMSQNTITCKVVITCAILAVCSDGTIRSANKTADFNSRVLFWLRFAKSTRTFAMFATYVRETFLVHDSSPRAHRDA